MNIIAITERTPEEEIELEILRKEQKKRVLSDTENARLVFLDIKSLWNCEC